MADDPFSRYRGARSVLGKVARTKLERVVKEVLGGGEQDSPRRRTDRRVEELIERGRAATADVLDTLRNELTHQLSALGVDATDLAHQAADFAREAADHLGARARERVKPRGTASYPSHPAPGAEPTTGAGATRPTPAAKKAPRTVKKAAPTAKKVTGAAKKASGVTKKAPGAARKAAGPTKKASTTAKRSAPAARPSAQKQSGVRKGSSEKSGR